MLEKLLKFSTKFFRYPKTVITICVLLTIVFGFGLTKLKINNSVREMVPKNNPERFLNDYYEDDKRFGNSDVLLLAVHCSNIPLEIDSGKFESQILDKIQDKNDKSFIKKLYKINNGKYSLKNNLSKYNKARLIKIYESIGYKGDVYSEEALKYVYDLRTKIESLSTKIQKDGVARLLKLNGDEAQTVISLINQSSISNGNYNTELKALLSNKDKLVNENFIDANLADKIVKNSPRIDLKELYTFSIDPIKKIDDITNTDFMENINDELQTKTIIPDVKTKGITSENIKVLPSRIASWDMYLGSIASKDRTITSINIQLRTKDINIKEKLIKDIDLILNENKNFNITTYIMGEPVLDNEINQSIASDMIKFFPLVLVVIMIILFLCFKNFEGVFYPLIVVGLTSIWSVGAMAFCNVEMTLLTMVMPVLLVAISSAYAIHQLNHYQLDHLTNKLEIFTKNMGVVGLAVTLSGITVMVGFGALASESFTSIRDFGIFTAIGDFFALLLALYLLPSALLANKKPKKTILIENFKRDHVGKLLKVLVYLNNKYSKQIIIASVLVTIIFGIGASFLKSDLNPITFFKENNPIRVADEVFNEKLTGTQVLSVVIDSDLTDILKKNKPQMNESTVFEVTTPEILNKVEKFNTDVAKKFPYVTKIISLNDFIKKINQEINGAGNPEFYKIPDSKELISQYLLIFSGDISSVLTSNHDKLRITITMKRVSVKEISEVKKFVESYFSKDFLAKNYIQVKASGAGLLYWSANKLLVEGQILSIIFCIIVVFLLLLFVFKNLAISFIALIPNLITIVINFGVLGFFNIPLSVATAMVSSIAVGIGVDYAIHYMTWYRSEIGKHKNIEIALRETIMHKGRAILYNMFLILGGFLVLTVSNFIPMAQFGALVGLCMLTTGFGALILIPAIMKLLAKKDYKFLYMNTK